MSDNNHITRTISNDAYWQINKHLHKHLGLRTVLLLQHFIDLQTKLFYGSQFFQSYKQIEKELRLSEYHIKDSIKKLKEAGILSVEKKGMPAKNYYYVSLDMVKHYLSLDSENLPDKSEVTTSKVKITTQVSEKSPNKSVKNHPTYKRIKNKNNKGKKEVLIKPSKEGFNGHYNNTINTNSVNSIEQISEGLASEYADLQEEVMKKLGME